MLGYNLSIPAIVLRRRAVGSSGPIGGEDETIITAGAFQWRIAIFESASAGLAATASGEIFFVPEAVALGVWTNHEGNAEPLGHVSRLEFERVSDLRAYDGPILPPGVSVRTRVGSFDYEVAAAAASDHHLATVGGTKLYCLPDSSGALNVMQFGAVGDDVHDDWPAFNAAVNYARGVQSPRAPEVIVPEPPVRYFLSQELNLKRVIRLRGTGGGGLSNETPCPIRFPPNTRGIIVNRVFTFSDTVTPFTTAADSSIIEGISLIGGGGDNPDAHGIWLRARALVRDFRVRGFPGNGVHIRASAISNDPAIEGNANNFKLENGRITGCGQWGVFVNGSDVNAGMGDKIDCSNNKRGGIYDSSFLGNTWVACHTNGNGWGAGGTVCTYNGSRYGSVFGSTEEQLVETEPGTDSSIWLRIGAGSPGSTTHPDWSPGLPVGTYKTGGPYVSTNLNARCTWLGCYVESAQGPCHLQQSDWVVGGAWGSAITGRYSKLLDRDLSVDGSISAGQSTLRAEGTSPSPLILWNPGGYNVGRGVGTTLRVGADPGFNVARIEGAVRTSGTDGRTGLNLQIYDGLASAWVTGLSIRGNLNDITPGQDNTFDLGDGAFRFAQVFAANGTINTSDAREKQDIGPIPEAWLDAWGAVEWSRFKWIEAAERKGEGARWHVGLIAQQVQEVFAARGIDAFQIGLLCHDRWDEVTEPVVETRENPETGDLEEVETGELRVVQRAGERLGIRYDQAQALEAAWVRRALARG